MPPSPFKKPELSLGNAAVSSLYVRIRCGRCRIVHVYDPDDLVKLCGDLAIYDVAARFRCERCKRREYLRADWHHVYGPDIGKTVIRRLVGMSRREYPVWRDDIL